MPLLKLNPSWGSKTRIFSEALLDFWDIEQLRIKDIWEKYDIKGQNVNVFVLDTGIDTTNISFANHNITAKSFVENETPEDVHGHGTWCCGKINADKVGIAPECHLFSAKVMDASGYGSDFDINKALTWALENNPQIISMSLGGYNLDKEQEKLCAKIFEKGGIILSAAGNERTDDKTYPAAFKNVLAITAIDQERNKADFANYGQHIAVAAPGVACYSTILNNQFRKMSGTSMATPVTAGLLALGISYILKKKQKYGIPERDLIIQALEKSAIDLGTPGFDIYYGFGGIDGLGFMEHLAKSIEQD
jgi:subtilisin family serine protease